MTSGRKTAIAADSNSGIFEAEGKELGVYILPMPVIIEGREYFEGVDLSIPGVLSEPAGAQAGVHLAAHAGGRPGPVGTDFI